MGFEADAEAGGDAYQKCQCAGERLTGEMYSCVGGFGIQCGSQHVGKTEEGEEMVALTEVPGRYDGEDDEEEEGERPEVYGREASLDAAEDVQGDDGRGDLEEENAQFEEDGDGQVQEFAEGGGDEQDTHDEGRIGLQQFGAVECCSVEDALSDVETPELVVADGWKQSEEDCHAGSGEGEQHPGLFCEMSFDCYSFVGGGWDWA